MNTSWSGLPFPIPGDLPKPGIERTTQSPALAGVFFTTSITQEALHINTWIGLFWPNLRALRQTLDT